MAAKKKISGASPEMAVDTQYWGIVSSVTGMAVDAQTAEADRRKAVQAFVEAIKKVQPDGQRDGLAGLQTLNRLLGAENYKAADITPSLAPMVAALRGEKPEVKTASLGPADVPAGSMADDDGHVHPNLAAMPDKYLPNRVEPKARASHNFMNIGMNSNVRWSVEHGLYRAARLMMMNAAGKNGNLGARADGSRDVRTFNEMINSIVYGDVKDTGAAIRPDYRDIVATQTGRDGNARIRQGSINEWTSLLGAVVQAEASNISPDHHAIPRATLEAAVRKAHSEVYGSPAPAVASRTAPGKPAGPT